MTDAVEPVRHGVLQEAPDELVGGQRHHLSFRLVAVVLPGEADLTVVEPGQAAIGDGDAMGIAAEVGEHLLRAGERTFGIE